MSKRLLLGLFLFLLIASLQPARFLASEPGSGDWPMWDTATAGLVYVRLHGYPRTYASEYGSRGLRPWVERIEDWLAQDLDVYVFFDNDIGGAAPRDALLLQRLIDSRART